MNTFEHEEGNRYPGVDAQRVPNRPTSRHIIIKMAKVKNKESYTV